MSAVLGAIATPPGWRAKALWALSALFVILAIYWLFGRAWFPVIATVLTALFQSGALLMIGTVAIVALMNGSRSLAVPPAPSQALSVPETRPFSIGQASLREVVDYLRDESQWGAERERGGREIFLQIKDAAFHEAITTYGRFDEPDSAISPIANLHWERMGVTHVKGTASGACPEVNYLDSDGLNFYDVRFSWSEVRSVWPPKAP